MKIDTLNNLGVINSFSNQWLESPPARLPHPEEWSEKKPEVKPIHIKTGSGRKLKFLRVLVALHEAGFFVDDAGGPVDQQDVFAAFTQILDVDLSRAHSNLNDGLKHHNQPIRLQVFDDLKEAYKEYEDELKERQRE